MSHHKSKSLTLPIDYSRYPPNWKKEIVPAVITRAGNCCEKCGSQNKSMQWRGRKIVEITSVHGRKRKGWATKHYDSKEAAIADGCKYYDFNFLDVPECEFTDEEKSEYRRKNNFDVYQTKIILTIAHLDHDETNWDVTIDRLRAWCQLCHLQYDAAEKYRRSTVK